MTGVLITLIAYQVLMLGIGWWASQRNTDSEDFYLGGRKLGGTIAALSASASSSSAWTLLGVSGAALLQIKFGQMVLRLFQLGAELDGAVVLLLGLLHVALPSQQ